MPNMLAIAHQRGQALHVELNNQQCGYAMARQYAGAPKAPPAENAGLTLASDEDQEFECMICFDATPIYRPLPCRCMLLYCHACVRGSLPIGKDCHMCRASQPHVTGGELMPNMLAIAHQRGQALDVL
jgi:hypothetical protein